MKSYIDNVFDDEDLTSDMTRSKLNSVSSIRSGEGKDGEANDSDQFHGMNHYRYTWQVHH
jgi:hypothetical protein